jgi:hypothetical protein
MNNKYISGNTVLKTHSWIILNLIVLFFAFLCNCCSTKANKGTISGTVTLFNDIPDYYIENPMDFSGVTVALYKTAVLDTTLVRINQQYPQIGVQITQETEFDHRNFKPLKVTTTDPVGKFSFPSLTPGDYNIVIWKNEWGIRYICSVKAIENENNNIGNIVLYPETIYNSTIVSEPTIFKSDHSYFILTDVNYTSSVEFQPRTQIFINPGCMVKFYGAVTTPEFTSSRDMWKITSGKEIYSTSPVTMDFDSYYSAVNFYGEEINLRSGFVRYGSNALMTVNVNNNNFFYMVFRDCGTALTTNQGNCNAGYMTISDCNTIGILYTTEVEAIYNVSITRIIFNNNAQKAVAIQRAGMLNINNCYFNNNNHAINIRNSNNKIEYNEFNLNYYNIYFFRNYYPTEIHYNNFYKTISGIQSSGSINNINNNNFYGPASYFICILYSISPYSLVSSDVNATNNYWAVEEISQYLADAEDDPRCPYHIIYLPKLSNPVMNAGIQ